MGGGVSEPPTSNFPMRLWPRNMQHFKTKNCLTHPLLALSEIFSITSHFACLRYLRNQPSGQLSNALPVTGSSFQSCKWFENVLLTIGVIRKYDFLNQMQILDLVLVPCVLHVYASPQACHGRNFILGSLKILKTMPHMSDHSSIILKNNNMIYFQFVFVFCAYVYTTSKSNF